MTSATASTATPVVQSTFPAGERATQGFQTNHRPVMRKQHRESPFFSTRGHHNIVFVGFVDDKRHLLFTSESRDWRDACVRIRARYPQPSRLPCRFLSCRAASSAPSVGLRKFAGPPHSWESSIFSSGRTPTTSPGTQAHALLPFMRETAVFK